MQVNFKKLIILSLAPFILCSSASATNTSGAAKLVGQVIKLEGTVLKRIDEKSVPSLLSEPNAPLNIGNQLLTKKDSRSYISWIDGSKIVMKESSRLSIKAINYLNVDDGQVLFDISKIQRPRPVQVGVKLAILGIRGTRFLVDTKDDEYNVYLKHGNVSITSLTEEFQVYKNQIEAQMRKFKEQLLKESDQYKSNLEAEFKEFKEGPVESVKEFNLVESAGISIKGNVITLIPIPKEIDEEFKLLDSF